MPEFFPDSEAQLTRRAALRWGSAGLVAGGVGIGLLAYLTPNPKLASLPGHAAAPARAKPKKPGPPLKDWPSVDALAERMINARMTPGVSISVAHAGTLLYSKGFGTASFATNAPVTAQSSFRIGSITKQFTAAAILLMAERGVLKIDDTLSKFMPSFPRGDEITLHQMMSHTSGLSDYLNGQSQDVLVAAQDHDYSAADLVRIIEARRPLYRLPPGTDWLYSNSGFTLLSIIVEQLTGMAFGAFCAQHLFGPAGMDDSAIDSVTAVVPNLCDGYRPDFRAPHEFDEIKAISPSFGLGAGGIRSTTEDLCAWHAALLGGKILKPATLRTMFTPVRLNSGRPAIEHGNPDRVEYACGIGVGLMGDRMYIVHGGRVNGFTGHLRSFPGDKLTLSFLYNSDGSGAGGYKQAERNLRWEATRLAYDAIGIKVDPREPADGEVEEG